MARPTSRYPTELELEILKVLWREGPLSGRGVRDALAEIRDLAYTSVMTIMKIMTDKKYVRREKVGGNFIYCALVAEKTVTRRMLGDIVDRVFNGSAAAVMLNLLQTSDLDEQELKQLRQIVNQRTREQSQ
jgi:BlaI family penicillinase repressor